jgi:hypothetical protein
MSRGDAMVQFEHGSGIVQGSTIQIPEEYIELSTIIKSVSIETRNPQDQENLPSIEGTIILPKYITPGIVCLANVAPNVIVEGILFSLLGSWKREHVNPHQSTCPNDRPVKLIFPRKGLGYGWLQKDSGPRLGKILHELRAFIHLGASYVELRVIRG